MNAVTRSRLVPAVRLLGVRTVVALPVTLAVSATIFFIASLSPLDPLTVYLGDGYQSATLSQRTAVR